MEPALAGGRLTRDWHETSARSDTDEFDKTLYASTADADRKVVEAMAKVAANLGNPPCPGRARVAPPEAGITSPSSARPGSRTWRTQLPLLGSSSPTRTPVPWKRRTFRTRSPDSLEPTRPWLIAA